MFKRIAAILLLSLLLFNWVGYRVLISWCESHAANCLDARLDAGRYDTSQLVLFRISADLLPYSNAYPGFERADGEIEIGQVYYRCVKKRLYNDSLEFLCIPEITVNNLKTAKNDFFSLINELQKTSHGKIPGSSRKAAAGPLKICFLQDHFLRLGHFHLCPEWQRPPQENSLPAGYPPIGKQPPRPLV